MRATDIFIWGIVLGIVLMYVISRRYKRFKTQKMLRHAKAAEKKAVVLLEKWGYTVLAVQLRDKITMAIDGTPHECQVRADLLVRKGLRRYIVEVKTGGQTQATLPNVRRQLLEYDLVYRPDGMLLLDMEKEALKEIKFIDVALDRRHWLQNALWAALGIFLGYAALKISGRLL